MIRAINSYSSLFKCCIGKKEKKSDFYERFPPTFCELNSKRKKRRFGRLKIVVGRYVKCFESLVADNEVGVFRACTILNKTFRTDGEIASLPRAQGFPFSSTPARRPRGNITGPVFLLLLHVFPCFFYSVTPRFRRVKNFSSRNRASYE